MATTSQQQQGGRVADLHFTCMGVMLLTVLAGARHGTY